MKTYRRGEDLKEGLKQFGARTVWVEFDGDLAAALLGQEFSGPLGQKVRIEKVRVYRAESGVLAADPVIRRVDGADAS